MSQCSCRIRFWPIWRGFFDQYRNFLLKDRKWRKIDFFPRTLFKALVSLRKKFFDKPTEKFLPKCWKLSLNVPNWSKVSQVLQKFHLSVKMLLLSRRMLFWQPCKKILPMSLNDFSKFDISVKKNRKIFLNAHLVTQNTFLSTLLKFSPTNVQNTFAQIPKKIQTLSFLSD